MGEIKLTVVVQDENIERFLELLKSMALVKPILESSVKFCPPQPDEVTKYAASINFALDGTHFCDFYEARGWLIGKNKMMSWKAAVRTWKARRSEEDIVIKKDWRTI